MPKAKGDKRPPNQIPEDERDYYLERMYPSFGNLAPRDIASRAAKTRLRRGPRRRARRAAASTSTSRTRSRASARRKIEEKYGNLFEMYERITGENPYEVPMRIYPAIHYTMGGLWVDYNLMSTIPGLFVLGEANFSDHGANRLGASALMQGLADGYFIIPYTIGNYLAREKFEHGRRRPPRGPSPREEAVAARTSAPAVDQGQALRRPRSTASSARSCGTTAAWRATRRASSTRSARSRRCARSSGRTSRVPGSGQELNQSLEVAGRVADFLELGELMCLDALERDESCGGHFRTEHQMADGEAKRDDEKFCHVAAWEYTGDGRKPNRHVEPLTYENVELAVRSYK